MGVTEWILYSVLGLTGFVPRMTLDVYSSLKHIGVDAARGTHSCEKDQHSASLKCVSLNGLVGGCKKSRQGLKTNVNLQCWRWCYDWLEKYAFLMWSMNIRGTGKAQLQPFLCGA